MNTKASNMSGDTLLYQNHAVGHRLLDVVCWAFVFFLILKMHTCRCVGTNRERSCTYHCVHKLRSMPVRALQQRMAVFIRTEASFSGSAPSKVGDQWPPMAMASSLPRIPTRNWKQRSSNGLRNTGKLLSALEGGVCGGHRERQHQTSLFHTAKRSAME